MEKLIFNASGRVLQTLPGWLHQACRFDSINPTFRISQCGPIVEWQIIKPWFGSSKTYIYFWFWTYCFPSFTFITFFSARTHDCIYLPTVQWINYTLLHVSHSSFMWEALWKAGTLEIEWLCLGDWGISYLVLKQRFKCLLSIAPQSEQYSDSLSCND